MREANSTSDVFRFIQIRPPVAMGEGDASSLNGDSQFAREVSRLPARSRASLATARMRELQPALDGLLASQTASEVLASAERVRASGGTVQAFLSQTGHFTASARQEMSEAQVRLSDLLLAAKFARGRRPPGLKRAAQLFQLQAAVLESGNGRDQKQKLSDYLAQPIALPTASFAEHGTGPGGTPSPTQPAESALARREAEALNSLIDELAAFALPECLQPEPAFGADGLPIGGDSGVPFALTLASAARLSASGRQLLAKLSLNPTAVPLHDLIGQLESQFHIYLNRLSARPPVIMAGPAPEEEARPYLKTVGVADLLVVKQHLKRYDRMDIAHVENILAKEKKSRTHRALERVEETFTVEREITQERETELETAERFEMQRETTKTIQEDQRFGFGLTLSGKYGPSVEFSSNASADASTSSQESARSATTYAKDVMSRSLERVVERVREEQILKLVREREETNLHEFNNETSAHVIGVYQFLEKVYESQVFNYGVRQMFDFMVPEPASYLWFLESSPPTDLNMPAPPPRLASFASTSESINALNYPMLAALYSVEGLQPPPPFFQLAAASHTHGTTDTDEEGRPRTVIEKEIPVPDGYRPYRAQVMPIALTDNHITMAVNIGRAQRNWKPAAAEITNVGGGHDLARAKLDLNLLTTEPFVSGSKLTLQVMAYETATFGIVVNAMFVRTPDAYKQWQIKTYDAVAKAYAEAVREYDLKVAELKAAAENAARTAARYGNAPTQNALVVKHELKKHCMSIVTRQRFDEDNGMVEASPPYFDFGTAEDRGAFTRFFEQAFEWDQMQYVCYPYYWTRKQTWQDRLLREDVDPVFLEFLKAGAARVVVPVRPGFEVAVSHYLETEEIWNGEGDPPPINSPLYFPIVEEIKERTGASQGEVAVGEPWDTHLPTPLVILRREDNLPKWTRSDPAEWDWEEGS